MSEVGYWITQKGSSDAPRRSWSVRDLLNGTVIQHFSLAVGPSAQRSVRPGDRVLIYWPGAHLFMGTFDVIGPVGYHDALPEGWRYAVPLSPRIVLADPADGVPLIAAMALGGEKIRRFARGACARGLYRIDHEAFEPIEAALAPFAYAGEFHDLAE